MLFPLLFQLYLSCTSSGATDNSPVSSTSPSSSGSVSSSDHLQKYILPLLTTLSLMLRMPASALTYLNEMDKTMSAPSSSSSSSGAGASSSASSVAVLQRAQALVLSKAHKAFKKDIKAGDMGPQEAITFEFLRANLEYIKVRQH